MASTSTQPAALGGRPRPGGTLGVYIDDVYWVVDAEGERKITTDRSFVLFLCAVGAHYENLVLFGRTVHADIASDYVLPPNVDLVELPHYSNLGRFPEVVRAIAGTFRGFWRGLRDVDTLWAFGPHPFALVFALLGLGRRKHVFLGVRQDSVRVYRARLSGWQWAPVMLVIRAIAGVYRLLSRRVPTTVQGAELERLYGGPRPGLLAMTESVVRADEVVDAPLDRDWTGQLELLTVGRLEPEKNPLLLVDAVANLERERPGRFRLTWVGRGPLDDAVRARAEEHGIMRLIDIHGYVAYDQGLLDLYRRAHSFVHVSFSEGVPKVLLEALASGAPIVATDVGGVRSLLDDGEAGLLVPANDLDALVTAIMRLTDDADLRERLVSHGLELARSLTLEAEAERVADFMEKNLAGKR